MAEISSSRIVITVLGKNRPGIVAGVTRVLGEKEVEAGNISVRDRSNETVQMSVDEFVAKVTEEIKTRA